MILLIIIIGILTIYYIIELWQIRNKIIAIDAKIDRIVNLLYQEKVIVALSNELSKIKKC